MQEPTDATTSDHHPPTTRTARFRDRTRDALDRRFGLDPRALAAFRVALGITLLFDVLHRSRDLVAFYTDEGAVPRALVLERWTLAPYSIHAASGEVWVQGLLFAIATTLALALIVGYRTRLVTALSLALLFSLRLRNPFLTNGADRLLLELTLLAVFLPLERRWAVDARAGERVEWVATPATAAYTVYVVGFFLSNARLKLQGEHWPSGQALHYALRQDHVTILLGNHLPAYPLLLELATYGWLGLLVCSPLLVVFVDRLRLAYVMCFIGAVFSMAVTMAVGLFPLALTAMLLPFLPPRVWGALERVGSSRFDRVRLRVRTDAWVNRRILDGRAVSGRLRGRFAENAFTRSLRAYTGVPPVARSLVTARQRVWPVVLGGVLVFTVLWTVGLLGVADPFEPVDAVNPEENRWAMYAPDPSEGYGWYVIAVDLENGDKVDFLRQRALAAEPPADAAETIPSFRWRRYMNSVRSNDALAAHLTDYVCRRSADRYDAAPETVTVTYTYLPIVLDEEPPPRTYEVAIRSCVDDPRP